MDRTWETSPKPKIEKVHFWMIFQNFLHSLIIVLYGGGGGGVNQLYALSLSTTVRH